MGGLTFESPKRGPIAFTTLGAEQRRLLLEAMVATEVYWETAGDDCPDCLYACVTRASVLKALEAARLHACRNQTFLKDDPIVWHGHSTSREIFFSIVHTLVEELKAVEDEVLIVTDDFTYCEHPNIKPKKKRR